MSNYTEHLHRLRDLTAELNRLNVQAAEVYAKRRFAMKDAIRDGCYPAAIAAACGTGSTTVNVVIASLELDRFDWQARQAKRQAA